MKEYTITINIIIGLCLIFMIILSGCSTKYVCSNGQVVSSQSLCPINVNNNPPVQEQKNNAEVTQVCPNGVCGGDGSLCGLGRMCPINTPIRTGEGTMSVQQCINNKCVTQGFTVECASDADCKNGAGICVMDVNNPNNNKCDYPQPPSTTNCPNNFCDTALGENYNNCPEDC